MILYLQMNQMKKILIIDDEPSLLKILGKFLEKLKFTSEIAETGKKGLEIFQQSPNEFYGVIIDYNLPGSSSAEILRSIKTQNPAIKTVLSTGFSVEEMSKDFDVKFDATFQKPFSFTEVQKMITNL